MRAPAIAISRQDEAANYPLREIEVIERDAAAAELAAILLSTAADPRELDAVVATLDRHPPVDDASSSLRTTE